MADFSKESNFDWYDFSIKEEFDKLKTDYQTGIICEKFGFVAIANIDGVCHVAMPAEPKDGEVLPLGNMLVDWHEFCFKTNSILPLKS